MTVNLSKGKDGTNVAVWRMTDVSTVALSLLLEQLGGTLDYGAFGGIKIGRAHV